MLGDERVPAPVDDIGADRVTRAGSDRGGIGDDQGALAAGRDAERTRLRGTDAQDQTRHRLVFEQRVRAANVHTGRTDDRLVGRVDQDDARGVIRGRLVGFGFAGQRRAGVDSMTADSLMVPSVGSQSKSSTPR